jgi:hypothetical protein
MNLEEFDSVFCYNGKKICSAINLVSDVIGHDNSLTAIGIAGRAECPFFGHSAKDGLIPITAESAKEADSALLAPPKMG